jgi:hypothetical protein
MKITLSLMKNHPVIRVQNAAEADAVRMMERGLVAYYTVQKVLKDCQNDHEQSEEFNNGVKKCLELINACDQAIIQNPNYEHKALKYVDNQ